MGTRNLTCVMADGTHKIAQYGQWDGYPEGQGLIILKFLRGEGNIDKLRAALSKVRFLDFDGRDKEFIESHDKNVEGKDNRTPEQKRWFETFITRDLGGEILENVANATDEEILLKDELAFAGDSLFCEWAYVIDLDKNTFETYQGFNKTPLDKGERFASIPLAKDRDPNYYQVPHRVTYSLDALPTEEEFLGFFKGDEDDDDGE